MAGLPPYAHLAMLRAEGKTQEAAQGFLEAAAQALMAEAQAAGITLYPAVPTPVQRVANVERAQMLLECSHRGALQKFLQAWQPYLHQLRTQHRQVQRWLVDVDPQTL